MTEAATRKWLRAGTVGSPHGLDGSFHVIGASPALPGLGAGLIVAGRERSIVRRAGTDARPILRLDGCEDRAAAQALRGQELMIARDGAPPLEADEWWAEDLVGCTVQDGLRPVGTVRRLVALPSCEVLEVARTDGGGDLLVPLVRDAVRVVDIDRRQVDIDLRFLGED
jgi:16S rRNA processing protein RimM